MAVPPACLDPDTMERLRERRIEPITATVEQFRVISGLSKDSIYKLIRAGDIRSVVICGRRLIDLASYRVLIARTSLQTSPTRGGLGGGK